MTSTSIPSSSDEIAELRAEIQKLNRLVQATASTTNHQRSWRRPMALVATAVLAVGMLAGVAGASGSTTNVTFVPLSPAKLLLSNTSIASHKSTSPVVIGAATTVPADATTVELTVSAKGATGGTLNFYPALNVAGGSGQTLTYPSGSVLVSTTIQENVGQSGELTFYNGGSGTAVVTAKIIGYSTQVTAGDINGVGGSAGQVLTNTGSGAYWAPAGGSAYASTNFNSAINLGTSLSWVTVASITVPAGLYLVSGSAVAFTPGTSTRTLCYLISPTGAEINYGVADTSNTTTAAETMAMSGLLGTGGGTINLECQDAFGHGNDYLNAPAINAVEVRSVSGTLTQNAPRNGSTTMSKVHTS